MLCLILRTVREKYNINVSINHLQTKSIAIYQAERELINHWSDYKCRSGLCYITYTYEQLLNVYKVEIARLPSRHSFMFGAHVG